MSSSLLLVTGPPGAGKSTVAHELGHRFERSVIIAGDAFYSFLGAGAIAPWLASAQAQNEAIARAAAVCTASLAEDFDAVYEGVVGPWQLPAFMVAGSIESLDYAVLLPPLDVCLRRVAERVGHGFADPNATRQMHDEFAGADINARHVFTDVVEPADLLADEIQRRRCAGHLRIAPIPALPRF